MPAVVLDAVNHPSIRKQVTVGTTLQAFTIPEPARIISVQGDAALWVQFTGADGDAVSATTSFPVASGSTVGWQLANGAGRATSILVAAQAATATVYVVAER